MSHDSLFSKHLKIIEGDPSKWTEAERQEHEVLETLRLPPLPERKSWWQKFQFQIRMGFASAVAMSAAVVLFLPREKSELTAKGSIQVSAYWARGTTVRPLSSNENLLDGDKVGAGVISSEESFAYWAITDNQFKLLSHPHDIETSRLSLEPGVKKNFESSFELTSPNQGEHLVVIVCPKTAKPTSTEKVGALLDQAFVSRLIAEKRAAAADCMFVGYRLRGMP
jgi:hypothetical protein